ncbi:MAG: hypothetical protein R3260_15895 [Pseudomonas sp.]|nr:hypothetical protein [Pseudomonas sp.]
MRPDQLKKFAIVLSSWLLLCIDAIAVEPQAWLESTRGGKAQVLQAAELNVAERLFKRTFNLGVSESLVRDWQKLGFELTLITYQGEKIAALRELPEDKRGRGAYLIRTELVSAPLLQAPHRYFDKHSGTLVMQLFLQGPFKAAAWNTVHRREADLARQQNSYFTAFARALTASLPDSLLIQVHGYSSAQRNTASGRESQLILSAGHHWPSNRHRLMADCLQQRVSNKAMLFPVQTRELGGTLNPVASALHEAGFDNFVHLELSASLRQQLSDDAGLSNALASCLLENF